MIGIRVDANDTIALGHLMRCIAISEQLRKLGKDIIFITSDNFSEDLLKKYNYKHIVLNYYWKEKDNEIDLLILCLKKNNITTLIIDSYEITNKYLVELKKNTKIIYIDDLNMFEYDVDMIINYTRNIDKLLYIKYIKKNIKCLLGAKYTPLRREFHGNINYVKQNISNLLITTGGTDNYNMCYSIAKKVLEDDKFNNIKVHIIIGKFFKNKKLLYDLQKNYKDLILHDNVINMASIMNLCDLAISAGGTTLLELCSCGIATICFSISDNQTESVNAWGKDNLMISIGDVRDNINQRINVIINKLEYLKENYDIRKKYSDSCKTIVDGRGALRIAEEIIKIDNCD